MRNILLTTNGAKRYVTCNMPPPMKIHASALAPFIATFLISVPVKASGLNRDAADARALGMGGATNVTDDTLLPGIIANPASLGWLGRPVAGFTLMSPQLRADYTDREGNSSSLSDSGLLPDGALAFPLGHGFVLGLGGGAESGLRADWRYRDLSGGADGGTSYGMRVHRSEIYVARATAALAWQPNQKLTLGASFSAVWNRNNLVGPYIFQTQETLRTVKTLLDLEAEGWGVMGQVGVQWQAHDRLRFGLAYRSEARVETHGRARGNADVQLQRLGLGAARSDFQYDAEVTNVFPQAVTLGAEWQATDKLTLAAAVEWVNWQRTFDTLVVDLENGNNADLNGLVRGDRLHDEIPLRWRDQWVARIGAEYKLGEAWKVRGGYSWARSIVPQETLTPLTAVLPEHKVNAGLGWSRGPWTVDLGWEWQLPKERSVSRSALAAGEYVGGTTEVGVHWFGLTTTLKW